MRRTSLRIVALAAALATTAATSVFATSLAASAQHSAATSRSAPVIDSQVGMGLLKELSDITMSKGGTRPSGSPAHVAALDWMEAKLKAAGFVTQRQACPAGTCRTASDNLIADLPGGDPSSVHLFGAHMDSVSAGPGINDDGSGSMTVLAAALAVAQAKPQLKNHLRFGWWTDEEVGYNGSKFYVTSLSDVEKKAIKGYYNVEMTGTTNGGFFVSDARVGPSAPYAQFFRQQNIHLAEDRSVIGRSDDAYFSRAGIPSSTYATDVPGKKTAQQVKWWGGEADKLFDPCYHKKCDTFPANINEKFLGPSLNAVAFAMWTAAGAN